MIHEIARQTWEGRGKKKQKTGSVFLGSQSCACSGAFVENNNSLGVTRMRCGATLTDFGACG